MTQCSATQKNNGRHAFGTKEWAPHSYNFIVGCSNNCLYCYSKEMSVRFGRKDPHNWHIEEVVHTKLKVSKKAYSGRIMLPSSHDITPKNIDQALVVIEQLLLAGNELLIVSKPSLVCITEICKRFVGYKHKIVFRFTIGSPNDSTLRFWEPSAPCLAERIACLHTAYRSGFETSLSIEPMLDSVYNTGQLIKKTIRYVTDSIWVGKPNFLLRRLKMNGTLTAEVQARAQDLQAHMSNDAIMDLYSEFRKNPKIRWKDSVKDIVGLKRLLIIGHNV